MSWVDSAARSIKDSDTPQHHFRELWVPKWSEAFRGKIEELTGQSTFSYRIAVTRLKGDASAWSADPTIAENLPGCSFGFLPLEEMWATMLQELTTTPASSEMGRLAQLLKAAGRTAPQQVAPANPPAPGSDAASVDAADVELSVDDDDARDQLEA